MISIIRSTKKLWSILSKKQKSGSIILIAMMFVGGIMESVSVALIIPLITAVMNENGWDESWYSQLICEMFGITEKRIYIEVILVLLVIVFLVKNIFLLFEYYIQNTFVCRSRFRLQRDLMKCYMKKPYVDYLNASSGEIVRIMTQDTVHAFMLFTNVLTCYTELIVSIVLGITIFIMNPEISIWLVFILVFELLLINKAIKPVMKHLGAEIRKESAYANKWILQSVNGIKSIKVAACEKFFEDNYSLHATKSADVERKSQTLGTLPRLIIEAFTVSSLLLVILVMVIKGTELYHIIPQLSALVVAAVRLLPSTSRISSALTGLPYYEGALDNVISVINQEKVLNRTKSQTVDAEDCGKDKISFKECVSLNEVSFSFPNTDKLILDNVNMEIKTGQSIGIVGASGEGKTTCVDILLGLLKPQKGKILVDNINIEENILGWLSQVAYIPQTIFLIDDSIYANIIFGSETSKIDEKRVWKVLKDAQLEDFVKELPDGIYTQVGEQGIRLSGGQRQRIGIARALYNNPKILFFDEATSALDNDTEAAIMSAIERFKGKKTMVIVAHRLSTISNCDVVYRVQHGTIIKEEKVK